MSNAMSIPAADSGSEFSSKRAQNLPVAAGYWNSMGGPSPYRRRHLHKCMLWVGSSWRSGSVSYLLLGESITLGSTAYVLLSSGKPPLLQ